MKKLVLSLVSLAILSAPALAQEAPAAPQPTGQLVPVYQMYSNNTMSQIPAFYVLHGTQTGMVTVSGGAAIPAAGTTATAAGATAAGTTAAGATATTATTVAPAATGLGGILNPRTMINATVQGAVQGAVQKVIDN